MKPKCSQIFGVVLGAAILIPSWQPSLGDDCHCLATDCFCQPANMNAVLSCMVLKDDGIKSNLRLRMSECYLYHQCFEGCFQNQDIANWIWDIDTFVVSLPARYSPVSSSDYGDIIYACSASPTQDDLQVMLATCIYPPCSLD